MTDNNVTVFLGECLNRRWLYLEHGVTVPCILAGAKTKDEAGVVRQLHTFLLPPVWHSSPTLAHLAVCMATMGGRQFQAYEHLASVKAEKVDGRWVVTAEDWQLKEVAP